MHDSTTHSHITAGPRTEHPATHTTVVTEKPSKAPLILTVLAFVALAGFCAYLYAQLNNVRAEVAALNGNVMQEINAVRENSVLNADKSRRELEEARAALSEAIDKAQNAVGRARVEARKNAEKLAQDIAAKQQMQQAEINAQLSTIQDETASRFDEVTGSMGEVRETLASNRSDIDSMVSGLKTVNGDMGVMSGRIATNADELAALKALGERNYFEFEAKTSQKNPVRVGDGVQLQLRHTDAGKSRFTMDVLADDKRISKKDRTVNEPIQFYIGGRGGQPYEIVVNEVDRGVIKGYLAAPKVEMARR